MQRIKAGTFCAVVWAVLEAGAAEYHVVPKTGDDGSDGSLEKPWKTLERAHRAALKPGDRLLFEGGMIFAGTLRIERQRGGNPSRRGDEVRRSTWTNTKRADAADGTGGCTLPSYSARLR